MIPRSWGSATCLRIRTARAVSFVLGVLIGFPAAAQIPVIIHGRVQDAASGEAVAGALVIAGDSTNAVFTDWLGNFAIELHRSTRYVLHADQFGYEPTTFELPESAALESSLLQLEPAPITLEGITVVDESALSALADGMKGRRNAYSGLVSVLDRDRIVTLGGGSAFDLVRRRWPLAYECAAAFGDLCRRVRDREGQLLVCIDERRSFGHAVSELDEIPIESLALAEFYGPTVGFGLYGGGGAFSTGASPFSAGRTYQAGQVRIYTRQWIVSTAGRRTRTLFPAAFGC